MHISDLTSILDVTKHLKTSAAAAAAANRELTEPQLAPEIAVNLYAGCSRGW